MSEQRGLRARLAVPALYAGGFLGPFGGGIVVSMLPELGASFQVSGAAAAATLTAYLLPFAAFMLVSGTVGERYGALRTVRLAYVGYVVVSIGCALAPTFELFVVARVLQGATNAFTSPLLLAAVAAATPRERLGRSLGIMGALQAAGQTSAPLIGGLAAEADWRLAFYGVAAVAALLAMIGLPSGRSADGTDATGQGTSSRRPSLRSALRPRVLGIGAVALVGWACLGGSNFLVSFRAQDDFGFSAGARGVLLTAFGVTGILTAGLIGRAVDRWGARRCLLIGLLSGTVLMVGVGTLGVLALVAVLWAVAGISGQLVLVGVNSATLSGSNGGGAIGVVQSLRFFGAAAAPAAFTPIYHLSGQAAFLTAAVCLLLTAAAIFWRRPAASG